MSSNGRTLVRYTTRDAAKHLSAQPRSGLGVSAYCRRAGISVSSFYYWRQRERKRDRSARAAAEQPSFVELVHRPQVSACFRVELRNGTVVEVPSGFRGDELRELVGIVSESGRC